DGLRAEFYGFDRAGYPLIVGEGLIFRSPSEVEDGTAKVASANLFFETEWVPLPEDARPLELAGAERWLIVGSDADAKPLTAILQGKGIAVRRVDGADAMAGETAHAKDPWSDILFLAPASHGHSGWEGLRACLDSAQAVAGRAE